MSFSRLISNGDEIVEVAKNLSESYVELSGDLLSEISIRQLQDNLYLILSNYSSIKAISDSREIYSKNENNLINMGIITDLRLVFKDDVNDKNRAAIILHKLYLEYKNNDLDKELHLTLDIEDLNKLKLQIENAIVKDQILRDDYKEVLNFIF